jgi:multiple sugar transport system substrate-binding protein
MTTIKDVAKLAGVSHATVSNVMNGYQGVSLDKVQRVQNAIKALGYQPDAKARSLKTSRSMTVGVILPSVIDPCFSQIFTGIERKLSEKQYTTSLYITLEIPAKEKQILQQVRQQRVDGIIIATCQPQKVELFDSILQSEIKTVFIEREINNQEYNFVGFHNERSIFEATSRFLTNGYQIIAIVTGPEEYYSEKQCLKGYLDALAKHQVNINQRLIETSGFNKESAFKAAFRLLQLGETPEVIITSSSQLAEGVRKAITLCEYNLTKKPLVISLNEESWSSSSSPDMIKIARPAMLAGETAAEVLLTNIENPAFHENKRIILENQNFDLVALESRAFHYRKKESLDSLKVLMLDSSASYSTYSLLADLRCEEGINVQIETLPMDEIYYEIKKEALTSNYDVFEIDIPWISEFAEYGFLSDLSDNIQENPGAIADLIPGILDEYAKYDDRFFGLPYMYGTQLLFYRKDLFEDLKLQRLFFEQYHTTLKPPKTWVEYNAVAKFFTKKFNPDSPSQFGTTLGGRYPSGSLCEFLPRKWAYGGKTFDENANVVLNSKETIKALKNYCESYQYASPASTEYWWDEQVLEFCDGKAAMMVLFMSHATDISDRFKSKIVGKVGYDIIPGGIPLLGGWSLGINNNSRKKDLAFKFISWACRKELAIPHTILGGSTPCVNLYQSSELVSIYPWLPKAFENFNISRKRLLPKVGKQVLSEKKYEEILGEAVHKSITNQLTPEEAIERATEKFQQLITYQE